MLIGLYDADLMDKWTNFPNLALMKISAFYKERGHSTFLISESNKKDFYHKVYVSKVFKKTKFNCNFNSPFVFTGGTGFSEKPEELPFYMEHCKPDYDLYKDIEGEFYHNVSIGFTTRGCFRKCPFCVNRHYDKVKRHSSVSEFLDKKHKAIILLDDNIFGYSKYEDIFKELQDTGKPFQFKQGLDVRLLDKNKAILLSKIKYFKEVYFAFDDIRDKDTIVDKFNIYRTFCDKPTRCYVLCGYKDVSVLDIEEVFERISILNRFNILPYVMRYESVYGTEFERIYSYLAAYANQAAILKTMSFGDFCEIRGKTSRIKFWNKLPGYILDFELSKSIKKVK